MANIPLIAWTDGKVGPTRFDKESILTKGYKNQQFAKIHVRPHPENGLAYKRRKFELMAERSDFKEFNAASLVAQIWIGSCGVPWSGHKCLIHFFPSGIKNSFQDQDLSDEITINTRQ